MIKVLVELLLGAAGIVASLWLGVLIMRSARRSGRGAGAAAAVFASFDFVEPRKLELVQEAVDEVKHGRADKSGEPPLPSR